MENRAKFSIAGLVALAASAGTIVYKRYGNDLSNEGLTYIDFENDLSLQGAQKMMDRVLSGFGHAPDYEGVEQPMENCEISLEYLQAAFRFALARSKKLVNQELVLSIIAILPLTNEAAIELFDAVTVYDQNNMHLHNYRFEDYLDNQDEALVLNQEHLLRDVERADKSDLDLQSEPFWEVVSEVMFHHAEHDYTRQIWLKHKQIIMENTLMIPPHY